MLPLGKEEKIRKMTEVIDIRKMTEVIDIRIIIEDIIKVSLKTRKKNPKERIMIDVGKVTLFASNVERRDTLADTVTFKDR